MSKPPSFNWHRTVDAAFEALRAVTLLPGRYAQPGLRRARVGTVVTASLEDPVGELPLSQRLRDARRIVIVLPPPSEPVSTDLVEAVWAHVDAWMPENALVEALVARGGTDVPDAATAMDCPHVAVLVRAGIPIIVHSEDQCVESATGMVAAPGVPLVADRRLHHADLTICLSRVALRPDSGVRSPSELIARGCTGEATRLCIERLASTVRAGDCIGRPEDSAVTRLQNLVCRRIGNVFAVVEAAGPETIAHVSGNPEDVMRLLLSRQDGSLFVGMSPHSGAILVADDLTGDVASASVDAVLLALQQRPPLLAHAPLLLVLPMGCERWADAATEAAFLHGLRAPMTRRPATASADFVGRRISEMLSRAASAHPLFIVAENLPEVSEIPGVSIFRSLASALIAFRRAADHVEDDHADPNGVLLLQGAQYRLPQLGQETFLLGTTPRVVE
jgi:hypothetical protein